METNFNICDMFSALNEYIKITRDVHKKTRDDEYEENRFSCCVEVMKKDIAEMMSDIGEE